MSKITTFVHSVVCCQLLRSRPIIYLPKICCGPTGAPKSNMEPNATGSVHSRDVYKIIIVAGCSVNMWQNDKMTAFDKMEPRFDWTAWTPGFYAPQAAMPLCRALKWSS